MGAKFPAISTPSSPPQPPPYSSISLGYTHSASTRVDPFRAKFQEILCRSQRSNNYDTWTPWGFASYCVGNNIQRQRLSYSYFADTSKRENTLIFFIFISKACVFVELIPTQWIICAFCMFRSTYDWSIATKWPTAQHNASTNAIIAES
jgi:hypothetical protein